MPRIHGLVIALLSSVALTACISAKSFVDPSQPKVSYQDLSKRTEPMKLKLAVEFQRNGQPYPRADSTLKDNAERVLRGTGVIEPVDNGGDGEIRITVNNIGDMGQAAAKGFGTGLTFGLVGTTVMDAYELSLSITANGKTVSRAAIKHALYTAIGNTSIPEGVEAIPPNVAFGRVLEQMLLRALQDMQKSGDIVLRLPMQPLPWNRVASL